MMTGNLLLEFWMSLLPQYSGQSKESKLYRRNGCSYWERVGWAVDVAS
jgi:hypothetical protein